MRLIDADEVMRDAEHISAFRHGLADLTDLAIALSGGHTIEAEPVRHSRWFELIESVEDGHTGEYYEEVYYNCLNCDYATGDKTPYCPNCGATMTGGAVPAESSALEDFPCDVDLEHMTRFAMLQAFKNE